VIEEEREEGKRGKREIGMGKGEGGK